MHLNTLYEPGQGQRDKEEAADGGIEHKKTTFLCTQTHLSFRQQQPVTPQIT